ncbi:hypothetical protein [Phytohabitans rumicis]|uniref:Uncharacterized protein n=1 Tax=Phytohabitans rumicis TaxID=1076125 RepID=A0A6V8LKU4_9ACTN|nr:hypothetical protein [Phytohabitans rumicis]GFJ95259.1 hypothetical protein Prum_089010 [Phytohabitans rumicis]
MTDEELAPPQVPAPVRTRQRRWWLPATIGAAAVLIAVTVIVVVTQLGGGPAGDFADASDEFRSRVDDALPQVESEVKAATGGQLLDPKLQRAGDHMRAIADALDAYRASVEKIDFPDGVPTSRLVEVLTSTAKIVNVSAGGFAKSEFEQFLNRTWPALDKVIEEAAQDVRVQL